MTFARLEHSRPSMLCDASGSTVTVAAVADEATVPSANEKSFLNQYFQKQLAAIARQAQEPLRLTAREAEAWHLQILATNPAQILIQRLRRVSSNCPAILRLPSAHRGHAVAPVVPWAAQLLCQSLILPAPDGPYADLGRSGPAVCDFAQPTTLHRRKTCTARDCGASSGECPHDHWLGAGGTDLAAGSMWNAAHARARRLRECRSNR